MLFVWIVCQCSSTTHVVYVAALFWTHVHGSMSFATGSCAIVVNEKQQRQWERWNVCTSLFHQLAFNLHDVSYTSAKEFVCITCRRHRGWTSREPRWNSNFSDATRHYHFPVQRGVAFCCFGLYVGGGRQECVEGEFRSSRMAGRWDRTAFCVDYPSCRLFSRGVGYRRPGRATAWLGWQCTQGMVVGRS